MACDNNTGIVYSTYGLNWSSIPIMRANNPSKIGAAAFGYAEVRSRINYATISLIYSIVYIGEDYITLWRHIAAVYYDYN